MFSGEDPRCRPANGKAEDLGGKKLRCTFGITAKSKGAVEIGEFTAQERTQMIRQCPSGERQRHRLKSMLFKNNS